LHGGAGPHSFAALGALLADHASVLTPTHPGFGGTPRPPELASVGGLAAHYLQLLDELDLENVVVVGNSLGGWIAAEMAVAGSRRIAGIVLVDAVGAQVPGHPVADVSLLSRDELAARAWFDRSKMPDPAILPPTVQAQLPGNMEALAVYGGTMQDPTLLARLAGVAVPALVLWGEADRIGDVEYGRAYAAAIPGARFAVIPCAGHLPQIETPQALHAHLRDFAAAHAPIAG
jgi:pimeloyl-ACP methyl ester carboxylesterase